jgi:hypothetical protein
MACALRQLNEPEDLPATRKMIWVNQNGMDGWAKVPSLMRGRSIGRESTTDMRSCISCFRGITVYPSIKRKDEKCQCSRQSSPLSHRKKYGLAFDAQVSLQNAIILRNMPSLFDICLKYRGKIMDCHSPACHFSRLRSCYSFTDNKLENEVIASSTCRGCYLGRIMATIFSFQHQ